MGIQERRIRERERRRQQILVAAKNVFSRQGFTKSTMEDIARAAELSSGTLYLYFKNKDELYASLSLRIFQYFIIRLEEVKQQSGDDSRKRLELLKEAIYDVYEFDPLMFIKMFHLQSDENYQNLTDQLRDEIKALSRKALLLIASLFEPGAGNTIFISEKPIILAEMIWAFFSGIVLLQENKKNLGSKESDLKEMLGKAFEIFFRGIQHKSMNT